MRKAEDDRVKITTRHFRISIEEDEDGDEGIEILTARALVEAASALTDRRLSGVLAESPSVPFSRQTSDSKDPENAQSYGTPVEIPLELAETEKRLDHGEPSVRTEEADLQKLETQELGTPRDPTNSSKFIGPKKETGKGTPAESEALEESEKLEIKELHVPKSISSEVAIAVEDETFITGNEALPLSVTDVSHNLAVFHEENIEILCATEKQYSVYPSTHEAASAIPIRRTTDGSKEAQTLHSPSPPQERIKEPRLNSSNLQQSPLELAHSSLQPSPQFPAAPLLIRRYQRTMSIPPKHRSSLDGVLASREEQDSFVQQSSAPGQTLRDVEIVDQGKTKRRSTLPMVRAQPEDSQDGAKTPTYEDVLSGTSVNPIRRSSIASAAICSSLAPSLLSAFPGIPNYLLPCNEENPSTPTPGVDGHLTRGGGVPPRKLRLPFLRLHIPDQHPSAGWEDEESLGQHHSHRHHHHHCHHVFPHFHVPSITFTAPAADGETGRKFNFGIRRHSQTVSRVASWLVFFYLLFG